MNDDDDDDDDARFTEEDTWSPVSSRGEQPASRHAHSAVLHDDAMWVYGGMTDLQERNDFWRFDTSTDFPLFYNVIDFILYIGIVFIYILF